MQLFRSRVTPNHVVAVCQKYKERVWVGSRCDFAKEVNRMVVRACLLSNPYAPFKREMTDLKLVYEYRTRWRVFCSWTRDKILKPTSYYRMGLLQYTDDLE